MKKKDNTTLTILGLVGFLHVAVPAKMRQAASSVRAALVKPSQKPACRK